MMPEGAPPQQLPVGAGSSSTRELLDRSKSAPLPFLNGIGGTAARSEPTRSYTSGEAVDTSQQRRRGNRRSTLVRRIPGTECPAISLQRIPACAESLPRHPALPTSIRRMH